MWKCTNCGEQFEDRFNHCAYCGIPKTVAAVEDTERHTPAMPADMDSPQAVVGSTENNRFVWMLSRHEVWSFILKGVGLYLLFQALFTIPDLISGIYAVWNYGNLVSSLYEVSAESQRFAALFQQVNDAYRNLLIMPIAKILLCLGAGIYLIRGGGSLSRFLSRAPNGED